MRKLSHRIQTVVPLLFLAAAQLFGESQAALTIKVWPDRLHVRPGEPVRLQVTTSERAAVNCVVFNRLTNEVARFSGATDAAGQCEFVFKPAEEYGYEVRATATAGAARAETSEVFACSRNPWLVTSSYTGDSLRFLDSSPATAPLNQDVKSYADNWVQISRESYAPVTEVFSVAPCPFSSMVPPTDNYISGQGATAYKDTVKGLRYLIAQLHSNGLYAVVYADAAVSGVAGTEFARRHPEYLSFNRDGSILGGLNTETLPLVQRFYREYPQSMRDAALMQALVHVAPAGLHLAPINFTTLAPVKHGARELIKAREFFGFDGVRFDGHYVLGNCGDPLAPVSSLLDYAGRPIITKDADALSARNMRLAMKMILDKYPDYLFGFNTELLTGQAADSQEAAVIAPGNYILDESAKEVDLATEARNRWADYARAMAAEVDRGRRLGAFTFAGWVRSENQEYFKLLKAFTWAAGARYIILPSFQTMAETRAKTPWVHQYNQFGYRYSKYILGDNLERWPATAVDKSIHVTSARPVFYRDFVQTLNDPADPCLVVHLLNAPVEERVNLTPATPPPARDVQLAVDGLKLRGQTVFVLNPDGDPQMQPVPAKVAAGKLSLSAPPFDHWCIVVIPTEPRRN
jgi:hypothetical protein